MLALFVTVATGKMDCNDEREGLMR